MAERKFFLCTGQAVGIEQLDKYPKSHIIGELRHVMDEGGKVTALALYEASRQVTDAPAELPPLRAEIVGDARHIKCTCCEHRERWEIGKAAFLQLMNRYPRPA
jgi:hypothetical protein